MDKKDKKILYELDQNSKMSFTQIGKKVGMAPLTVRYRVNRLVKEGIIKKFITFTNASKLGYSFYKLHLKLQNVDEARRKEIILFLEQDERIIWVANFEGRYDIGFICITKNQLELQLLFDELDNKFASFIMSKEISVNYQGDFFPRDYLLNKKRRIKKGKNYMLKQDIVQCDKEDKHILHLLSLNSRIPLVDLSHKTNLSTETVMKRIKRLEKLEVITGYSIVFGNTNVPQLHYKLLLYLNNNAKDKIIDIMDNIKQNNRVFAIIKVLAKWDFEVDLEVESVEQLQEFTLWLTNSFSSIIKDYETLRIISMPKYFYMPK